MQLLPVPFGPHKARLLLRSASGTSLMEDSSLSSPFARAPRSGWSAQPSKTSCERQLGG